MNNHVMVVEDDQDIREGLTDALSIEGYDVYCACNGREALDTLKELGEDDLPDCILLDINMPQMDGREFIKEVEREEKLSEIPVCVASANGDLNEFENGHPAAVLRKPIDLDQLYGVVHRLCD